MESVMSRQQRGARQGPARDTAGAGWLAERSRQEEAASPSPQSQQIQRMMQQQQYLQSPPQQPQQPHNPMDPQPFYITGDSPHHPQAQGAPPPPPQHTPRRTWGQPQPV